MSFRFTPDPGKHEEIYCCYCGTKCSVERNRNGPRGFAQAMSGGSSKYDLFLCPNNDQDWHVRVEELLEEALGFKSDRLTEIVVCELEDLLSKSLGRDDISVYIRSDVQRYDSRAWISKTWAIEIGNMILSPYDKGKTFSLDHTKWRCAMPTTDPQLSPQHTPRRRRIVLQMEELSARLAEIALPLVKTALETEVLGAGAAAWKDEGEQALRTLLQDASLLDTEGRAAEEVIESLKQDLESPLLPDEEEIREHAEVTGRVMASSWLQFLALALRERENEEVQLDDALLPPQDEVRGELWKALRHSPNSLAVGWDEWPRIMQAFAEWLRGSEVDLPMGVALRVASGPRPSYVARRR